MSKRLLFIPVFILFVTNLFAQDIIVKKDGTILNVYNLEESNHSFFYTLDLTPNAKIMKINKEDVFSVKKSEEKTLPYITDGNSNKSTRVAITALKTSDFSNKKGVNLLKAQTPDGNELNYAILSENNHALTVVKGDYTLERYIIPEYVKVGNTIYTVTEIDDEAFRNKYKIVNIQFPMTLKKIGRRAFEQSFLESIILPEGLEEICERAFMRVGWDFGTKKNARPVKEIYIPSSVKTMGNDCFFSCGKALSPRKKCQAYFSNLPNFVTETNCDNFGIDDAAVKIFKNNK